MKRLARKEEAGSIAILYALTLLLLVGLAALILDLGALRADRRAAQTTADFASTAGAMNLMSDFGGSPQEACVHALRFMTDNTPHVEISDITDAYGQTLQEICDEDVALPGSPDDGFPDSDGACYAAADPSGFPPITVSVEVDAYVVTLQWPVDDIETDGYSSEIDGHRCERFSVQIDRTRGFWLTGQWGIAEGHTGAPAVARARMTKLDEIVAGLVVLDPHDCNVLRGGGSEGAGFHVFEGPSEDPEGTTGVIVIDSAGDGTGCTPNQVIEIDGNNAQILAGVVADDDGDGHATLGGDIHVRNGAIFSYALTPEGDPANAFNQEDVDNSQLAGGDSAPPLPGDPPVRTPDDSRIEREPWHYRYDCRDDYSDVNGIHSHIDLDGCPGLRLSDGTVDPGHQDTEYITKFRNRIMADRNAILDAIDDGETTAHGYNIVTGTPRCDMDAFEDGPVSGDWWFECDLDVGGGDDVEIDGNVVIMGDLSVGDGRFAVRAASSSEDGWMYIHEQFSKSGGDVILGRQCADPGGDFCNGFDEDPDPAAGVTVIMAQGPDSSDGRFQLGGNPGERFTWVAPYREAPFRWDGPRATDSDIFDFADLGLWTDYTRLDNQQLRIGGDVSNLVVDGIFYMPNAEFRFRGQGEMGQQRAQFIAYRADAGGGGALRLTPDPERAEELFGPAVALIR